MPRWLSRRMARLGRVITEAIVHHYGAEEFLRRLAHPFWFQSFGAVMGMDWHSSGITTSVYDETIRVMKDGVARAKLGNEDRASALCALEHRVRSLESAVKNVAFEGFVADERARSSERGGRTVFGASTPQRKQLRLFRD